MNPSQMDQENYTFDSGSRGQSSPFNRINVWEENLIPDIVRHNIIASVIVNLITSPFITASNFLVCWSIFKNQALRRNNYKLLLAFLALTDFLTGAVAQPLYIASRICRLNRECDPCIPDVLTDLFINILFSVSYYQVVLLSAERYLAIHYALRYNALVTFKNLMCAVAVPCVISLLTSISFFFVALQLWASVVVLLAVISSIFLIYCNIRVLIESKRHHRAVAAQVLRFANQENALSTESNDAPRSAEFKAVKTTALIVGVFLLFFIPAYAIFIPINIAKNSLPTDSFHIASEWLDTFLRLNSLVNPLVYCWRMSEIRQACYTSIRKILCKSE